MAKKIIIKYENDDDDIIAYTINNKQHYTRANVEKYLPDEEIAELRKNGFQVNIIEDDEKKEE